MKREFRFFGKNIFPLNEDVAKKLWNAYERYLQKYPFLQEVVDEVDTDFHCPDCGGVVEDIHDQIINSNQIICRSCGTTIFWKERST